MRLLIVTRETAADRRYGLGKSIDPIREHLERQGVACAYLTQCDAGERGWRVLRRVHRILAPALGRLLRGSDVPLLLWVLLERLNMGRLAARVAVRDAFTHVHCHDPFIALGLRLAAPLKVRRLRWGVTQHGFGSYTQAMHDDGVRLGRHVMAFLRRREAAVLAAAHWVITPTALSRTQLVRDLGLPAAPAHYLVIPHPAPPPPRWTREAARCQLGWAMHECVVLAVGRLVPLKAFDSVLRAFATVGNRSARLVILGDGDASSLLALAEALGVRDRVTFAVTDDIWPYYAAVDVYVSASVTESFGLANLEALCCGLPSVCTAAGGVPNVVGEAAWLVPPSDTGALARALGALVADPGLRQRLGELGRRRARRWPAVDAIARAHLAAYEGVAVEDLYRSGALGSNQVPSPLDRDGSVPPFQSLAPLAIEEGLRVLVVSPHADDEVFGCGGTLGLLVGRSARVVVVVLTDGGLGDPLGYADGEVVAVRRKEALAAAAVLGVAETVFFDLPDGALVADAELRDALAAQVARFSPDWIFAPTPRDAHRDHVAAARAACDAWRQAAPAARFFHYEVWTPVAGNRIVDISAAMQVKREALRVYRLPLHYCDYLGAAEGLARYRALHLAPACRYAEVFEELCLGEHPTAGGHD